MGRFVALALCAGAAAGVAGCGSSTVTSVVDPVAQAATISNKATGMRLTLAMRLSASALPAPITGSGGGVVDLVNHSGSLSLTMDLGSIPQVTALLGTGKLRIDEIERGSTFYLKLPPPLNRSPALHGKPWAKVNLTSAGNALGMSSFSSMLNNPASSDPSQLLRYLRATSGTVTKVGKQNVDGFNTTHYRARIELDRVPNAFPSSERAQVRRTIESLEQVAHLHAIPVDVWIDQQHLVRRMELSFAENVSGQGLTVGIRVDIPQYGPQSPPQPPPAGEVADLTTGLGTSTSTGASPVGG